MLFFLINRDFVRPSIFLESLSKEGFCSYGISSGAKQKINGIAFFIYSPIEIDPFSIQFDVSLVHPPASINWFLSLTNPLIYEGNKASHPPL